MNAWWYDATQKSNLPSPRFATGATSGVATEKMDAKKHDERPPPNKKQTPPDDTMRRGNSPRMMLFIESVQ